MADRQARFEVKVCAAKGGEMTVVSPETVIPPSADQRFQRDWNNVKENSAESQQNSERRQTVRDMIQAQQLVDSLVPDPSPQLDKKDLPMKAPIKVKHP